MFRRLTYALAAAALALGIAAGVVGTEVTAPTRQQAQQIVKDGWERAAVVDYDHDGHADAAAAELPAIAGVMEGEIIVGTG